MERAALIPLIPKVAEEPNTYWLCSKRMESDRYMMELVSSVVATVVDEEKQSEVSSSTCWSYIRVQVLTTTRYAIGYLRVYAAKLYTEQ